MNNESTKAKIEFMEARVERLQEELETLKEAKELIDFLKTENTKVSLGDKWLYGNTYPSGDIIEWTVLQRPYGKKNNRTLYSGESLTEAIKALKEG